MQNLTRRSVTVSACAALLVLATAPQALAHCPDGALATQAIVSPPVELLPAGMTSLSLPCPTGERLLSGGWQVTSPDPTTAKPVVLESHPDASDNSRWLVTVRNDGAQAFALQVYVQCTKTTSDGT
ncbi:hypothetical protein [Kitasatospora viridis]|uniref:Secreted protein n=1 Tax=Kitasatospora viridis TaxID=281105 RepID=A0A561TS99_9ACTN|nr:hypothetical protein [Kitasatospora viridis]TWF89991.1 hypothetical protein FHX73_1335 [Kitasatospora viridis]